MEAFGNSGDDEKRRLAVESAVSHAFSDIFNPFLPVSDLKKLMVTTFPDHIRVREWFNEISQWSKTNPGMPIQRFPKYEHLQDELLVGISERVNLSDDLTRIAAMNWKKQLYFQWDDLNPQIFIKPFLKQNGVLMQVSGLLGTGKTDYAMKLTEILLENNLGVLTNLEVKEAIKVRFTKEIIEEDSIENFYRASRMSDFLWQGIQLRKRGVNTVAVWDEVSQWMHRQESGKKESIDMSKFLRLIRKFKLNIVFLEQIDEKWLSIANELMCAKVEKESPKKLHYATKILEKNYNLWVESVPRTYLQFDTYDFAGFVNDINFSDMFTRIADVEGAQWDAIENYLLDIIMQKKASYERAKNQKEPVKIRKVRKMRRKVEASGTG